MAKNILEDVLPPERRSIRNIHLAGKRVRVERPERREEPSTLVELEPKKRSPKRRSRVLLFIGLFVVLVIIFLTFSAFFTGATVSVEAKRQIINVDSTFQSKKGATADLFHEIVMLEKDGSKKVEGTEEKDIEKKASGKIVVYNNFSTESQRLIKNTRFMSPTGLIFRISESIVIPGLKRTNGSATPGSIEVTVYADQAGKEYNIGLVDWTIPGFKGDGQKYETIYARSKTTMSGGLKGKTRIIDDQTRSNTQKEIEGSLKTEMLREVRSNLPSDYVLYDKAVYYEFEKGIEDSVSGNQVEVKEKGRIYGIIIRKDSFVAALAKKYIKDYKDAKLHFENPETLDVRIIDDPQVKPWAANELRVAVVGGAALVWDFDEALLKDALAGKPKKSLEGILDAFPAVQGADVILRPFWKMHFPSDKDKIEIIAKK